jgi:hypothetical protein
MQGKKLQGKKYQPPENEPRDLLFPVRSADSTHCGRLLIGAILTGQWLLAMSNSLISVL